MANPDRQGERFSRRMFLGYFKDKTFAIATGASGLSAISSPQIADRADILTPEASKKTVRESIIGGIIVGGAVELFSRLVFPSDKTVSRRETAKMYGKAAAAGVLFSFATPPAIGVVGTVDTYLAKPLLTDQTSGEILQSLQNEKSENERRRRLNYLGND